jgi:hypothetical protein
MLYVVVFNPQERRSSITFYLVSLLLILSSPRSKIRRPDRSVRRVRERMSLEDLLFSPPAMGWNSYHRTLCIDNTAEGHPKTDWMYSAKGLVSRNGLNSPKHCGSGWICIEVDGSFEISITAGNYPLPGQSLVSGQLRTASVPVWLQ